MEQSPTPRNVEARGGGFSFPVLSGGEAFSFSPPKAKKVAAPTAPAAGAAVRVFLGEKTSPSITSGRYLHLSQHDAAR